MYSMDTDVIPLVNICANDCPLLEEDVRETLRQFAANRAVACEMVIAKIHSAMAYHYILETFVESKTIQRKQQPFCGDLVDDEFTLDGSSEEICSQWHENISEGNIEVPPRCQFEDGEEEVILPQSVVAEDCNHCEGPGKMKCPSCRGTRQNTCIACDGSGKENLGDRILLMRQSCVWCGATGKRRCHKCKGRGVYFCRACKGKGGIRSYRSCSVKWQTFKDEHTTLPWDIPDQLVKDATGVTVLEGDVSAISPLTILPEALVDVCKSFLEARSKIKASQKILCQSQL
ncbi:protein SSUH2 homolog [Liolophura sinensis]|uniref:protein SSUH2 homolog n=1 Tax=Liolophura sinensis TaxID=3198878 RepID=UPI0031596DDA